MFPACRTFEKIPGIYKRAPAMESWVLKQKDLSTRVLPEI